jgi:hypothetical protein
MGLKVLGLALAAMTKRPPGWPGSPWAMSGDGGSGWEVLDLEAAGLPHPANANKDTSHARQEKVRAIIVTGSFYRIRAAQAREQDFGAVICPGGKA